MLLRELTGGDPPYTCKLIFIDDPSRFGHRVTDGDRVMEHVFTKWAAFEEGMSEKVSEGFAETERSLSRRVFVIPEHYWIVWLDRDTVVTQSGGNPVNWQESAGLTKAKEFRDRDRAVAAYHKAIADKLECGYREIYGRVVTIADVPRASRKPGKKKSR